MLRSGRLSGKAALALAATGAFALTGCAEPTGPAQRGQQAGPQTGQQVDALTLLRSDVKGSLRKAGAATAGATSVVVSLQGTADGRTVRSHGALVLGGPLTAELVTEDPADGPTTVRILGSVFYTQIPAKDRAGLNGKSWMRTDLGGNGTATGRIARQLDGMDPARQLKNLLAGGRVTVVGEETVAGVKTVHYTSSAPKVAYLRQADPKARPELERLLAGVKDVRTDLWVDEQYLMRRSRSVLGTTGVGTDIVGTDVAGTDIAVEYTDYGRPLDVLAPPAADTVDFAALMNGLKPGLTG